LKCFLSFNGKINVKAGTAQFDDININCKTLKAHLKDIYITSKTKEASVEGYTIHKKTNITIKILKELLNFCFWTRNSILLFKIKRFSLY